MCKKGKEPGESPKTPLFAVRRFPLKGPGPGCSCLPQENAKNEEILNSLKYVRPGGGFEPNFRLFEEREVTGAQAHPLFAFLREALPAPSDDAPALMTDPEFITPRGPVCRKCLLMGPDRVPVRRYSGRFPTIEVEPDIEALLTKGLGSA